MSFYRFAGSGIVISPYFLGNEFRRGLNTNASFLSLYKIKNIAFSLALMADKSVLLC
jgi:hypothetical protein